MPASSFIGGTIAASTPTDIVWAPADGVAPQYTKDGGLTWQPVVLPGVTDWSTFDYAYYLDKRTVTADRVLPDTFYLYYVSTSNPTADGVFKSTDGGATWTKVFNGQISDWSYYNTMIEAVPGEAGNLFFTGGPQTAATHPAWEPFYQSTDGGATCTAIPNVLEVNCFGFGAAAPGQSYPSIYIVGWVNNVYGIWQSDNNAQSWTQIGTYPKGDLDLIQTISGDPNTYGQVYVGFSGSGYAYLPADPAGPTPTSIVESPSTGDLNAGTVTLTLNLSSAVTVAGGTPTLTLNDGGTATYTGGSGTSALTFSYTVGAGQNTSALAATAVNLNGATVTDGSGNAANFLLAGLTQTGPQIDTTPPLISAISETPTAPVDQAPVVTTSNIWMRRNRTVAASSLFTATDPDGDPITTYAIKDPTGNGHFVVNGVIQASNTEIDLTAAQLAQTTYVSGTGSEQLSVRASDGTLWSAWQTVSINVAAPNEKAPVVTASSLTTLAGQTFAASSLFAVSDPNGDPIVTYALKDTTGNGYFVVNGVVQASNTEIDLTAAQLAQTTFVAGSATDQLSVRASDGWLWSDWQAPAVNVSPTPVIDAGATLELASAYPGTVTFASTTGTLKLDNSASFAGTVAGMSGSDTLDLADINFATIGTPTFNGTSTGGMLTVTDGSHTANIALIGDYLSSTWTLSSDGHGGTFVVDPPATSPVLNPSDPAAPATNALDQPVVTSPGIATGSTETGASLPAPSISSTTKDNAGLLSEVPGTTDCDVAQSLSFDRRPMIAVGETGVAIPSDDAQHNVVALLSQYTAGFQGRGDAGGVVSLTTTAGTSEATLALFAQPVMSRSLPH